MIKPLATTVVEIKVYMTVFSILLSIGGRLHFKWLPLNRIIAHYHSVDLISTLLDDHTGEHAPLLDAYQHRLSL